MTSCNEAIHDIEDLIGSNDITPIERYSKNTNVTVRAKRIKNAKDPDPKVEPVEKNILQSILPGTQNIYIRTWGCAHNNSDSEYMAGLLAAYGYNLTTDKMEADLWLLNSCTVKNPSEDTFRNEIVNGRKIGKHVVLAGCVPQAAPKSDYIQGLSVVGVHQIDRVVEVVDEALKGHSVQLLQAKKVDGKRVAGPKLALPKVRKNPLIEIIPINSGCLNACTYCKTKFARANLVSYPVDEIVERAAAVFNEGVCEIWLTSEDTGTYGRDIGSSLPELLWKLVDVIPDGCMLRLGMTNPPYILEYLEEMAKILAHPKVYSFLHVPVQSGSDSVLADMKREYCRADFEHIVDFLRISVPGISIATDIICGFPTETENDFKQSMVLCEKYAFPSLFINQFYPRPGTPAAKMQRIPPNLVKTRTKRLTDLFYSYEPNASKYKIGEQQKILVTEISHDKKHYVGHNKFYEQFLVPMEEDLLGKLVEVKIVKVTKFSLIAEIVQQKKDWIVCTNPAVGQATVKFNKCGLQIVYSNRGETNSLSMVWIFAFLSFSIAVVYRYYLHFDCN
ncbi:threonylcarbamoyladenosine tRNA methylthiotransferase [Toxorhynchites rutilus septentrionalis]|uniref:threonylcarbamoyladenosine tRNA methylthiotransferase n=1 Tax=Toxorhynchites rutilus septentrionalis TaxID=329112 RepID=UPI00247A2C10|nr:threonylcarbamoyladenosine tRNA methylthiotransferase [Toxorhynchites rutilus septentrionalis]